MPQLSACVTHNKAENNTGVLSRVALALRAFCVSVSESPASFNNHIGVPLTALGMSLESDAAVFEVGMSGQGEIRTLSALLGANVRVLTDIQPAHLAGCASQDIAGVLQEKLQLFEAVRPTDVLVCHAANTAVWRHVAAQLGSTAGELTGANEPARQLQQPLWAFGTEESVTSSTLAQMMATLAAPVILAVDITFELQLQGTAWAPKTTFVLQYLHENRACRFGADHAPVDTAGVPVCVHALGRQNAVNAAAAVATVCAWMHRRNALAQHRFGAASAAPEAVTASVFRTLAARHWPEQWEPAAGRMKLHQLSENALLLDDTYNANPASVREALHTLQHVQCTPCRAMRKLVLLGEMAELGGSAGKYHEQVALAVADLHSVTVVLWGPLWGSVGADVRVLQDNVVWFPDLGQLEAVIKYVMLWLGSPGTCKEMQVVLLKGSRCQRLERVVQALRKSCEASRTTATPIESWVR